MEESMRRYLGFVAFAVMALTMMVWAKSGGVSTADVRPGASISPYDIMSASKNLPVQQVDTPY
jgi:hypothetical protein